MSVSIDQNVSSVTSCRSGVPQGSVLGPVLFLLYVSPVARVLAPFNVRHHVYADDLSIISAFSTNVNSLLGIEKATSAVRDWYRSNGLLLNPGKSEALVVGTGPQLRNLDKPISITVAGISLTCKETVTLLGVQLASSLSMDQFVSSKVRSSNYHLRALRKIRPALSRQVAESVGRAIILSRLDYCNALLAGAASGGLNALQRVQNQVARSVVGAPRRSHAQPILSSLHWLPVRQRISYKLAVTVFMALRDRQPAYLASRLELRRSQRVLRSSDDVSALAVPRTKTKFAERKFAVAAPMVWNLIPVAIRNCDTLYSFKKQLKTWLFEEAFLTLEGMSSMPSI